MPPMRAAGYVRRDAGAIQEAVMTEPRDTHDDRHTQATADREPEVKPEPIPDLEVAGADAEVIRAGEFVIMKPTDSASPG
jgi:hypothetical protein